MQPEQQQRILGYFIEEAKDHLTTIEQGLLNLQNTLQDSEMVNEIFRAAHSIKGGAAMLGLNSIQRTAHRFEDFFKILKECQSIQVDHDIESLFLRMFDTLKALVDRLESDSGLTEDVANHLMSEVEPVFDKLEQHLESRVHQERGGEADLGSDFLKSSPPQVFPSSLLSVFQNNVPEILRQMLHLFKQAETQQTRKELEEYCNQLAQLGEQFNLSGWSTLCETAAGAIASSENYYRTLAPIVIKEVKQAQELVLADRANEIATCEQLQALSIKTFLFDWEDTNTTFESQAQQITEMMVIAEQESTELSSIGHNAPESEFLAGISELSTQEQISDWVAEDNLSNLFALNPDENKQNWQENSAISDFLNLEDDLESSLIEDSGDILPLISSEETSALNSLFDEAQDTSLDLNTAEPGFCDLFKAPEADLESLDLLEVSTTDSTETPDLSSLWTEETNTPTQSELEKEEFSFSLDANDSFVSSTESFTLPIDSFEKNNDVNVINDTATNNSELEQTFDDFGLTELEVDLTTVLECNLSNDSTEFLDPVVDTTPTDVPEITADVESSLPPIAKDLFDSVTFESESSLNLFEEAAAPSLTELDFNFDSSSSDLFNSDTTPSQELFETSSEVPASDSATELNELDFNLDSGSSDLFNFDTTPSLELFETSAEVPATDSATDLNQLNFNLEAGAQDLFSHAETEPNLEVFEASDEVPATDSATELMAGFEPSEMELDLGLDSSSSDLFNSDTTPSLELFEASAEVPATDSASELMAGFELGAAELNFNLEAGAQDLFSHEEVEPNLELAEIESNLELFEASDQVSATDSATELMAGFELGAAELNFNLEAGAQGLFSHEDTLSNLELFEASAEVPVTDTATELTELDFSVDSSSSDLFNSNTEPNLELFEASTEVPASDSATELMAGFELGATELDLDLDFSDSELFNSDTTANLEVFEASAEVSATDSATELNELDFNLDSSSSDLFNSDTAPSLELFQASDEVSASNSATELMAGFELGAIELNLGFDAGAQDLFSHEEIEPNLELFEASAEVSATDSATELNELDFNLDSSSSDFFNSDTEPNLELFEASSEVSASDSATELTELNFSVDSSSSDLFNSDTEPNLELFEASSEVSASDSATELMAGFELGATELDLDLDSSDSELFNSDTEPNLELFEASAEVPASDSATELMAGFELGATELDLGFEAGAQDLFSYEEIEPNLELFEASAEVPASDSATELNELDFNLDSSTSDLFNSDTEPNLELFEASAEVPASDSAAELMAGFELGATELDLGFEAGAQDLFSYEEIEPNLELFEASAEVPIVENAAELMAALDLIDSAQMALEDELNTADFEVEERRSQIESIHEALPASVVSDAVTQEEQPNSSALEGETDDFADLEALLNEESISDVLPTSGASIAPGAATVAPVTMASATESSNDEFGDLDKLLGETSRETASATPTQPQQKQTATNSRRSAFEQMMRVPVKQLDSISNQVGELVVYRNSLEQDQERLHQFLDNLLHQVHQLSDVGTRMQELYERSLVEASLLGNRQGSHSPLIDSSASAPKGHVTGINFDALEMDRFTGFHTLAQEMIELIVRVREASSDIEFVTGETEQVARQFRQVTTQLQEGITRSRMVPFSQIAERLPRAVKDISFKYGKQAELQIEGKDTLIDKVILEQLYDPMTHLVNNAITHGIESPEERSQKGKSPVGQITIWAFHQGNQTVITISDDGAGIDPERVKAKAVQNGLITPEAANNMSRLDVYNLLFHAGFSTKDKVDEFAGRGVGMDVVLTSLSQMRGTITTDSTLGKGTTFTIRLPLTLSICKALCCLSDKARIAFPMDGVEQMIDIPQEEVITNAEGQSCIPWRDSLLPFRHLREFLTFNRQISRGSIYGSNRDDNMISILVLRSADMFFAIQVDQVLGEQEIVIKQFEAPAPKPAGIAGATILGDGRVMPIADVLELIDLSMGRIRQNEGTWWTTNNTSLPSETQPALKTEPMVLIVDDSITVRELLSMTFVNAGYRVEQARDGQEAWDKLRDGLPCDLIFCDIEMPRMDGLELLSRLQQDPKLSQLPISMLTSRGSDRHRQMALQLGASGYFTKPYLEEALLDGAQRMLKGEVLLTPSSSNVNV